MQSHIYEKIEAYLTNRLNDPERNAFEKAIFSDPDLKETVVKMQLLRRITERNLTRSKIISIHNVKTSEWKRAIAAEVTDEPVDSSQLVDENEVEVEEAGSSANGFPDAIVPEPSESAPVESVEEEFYEIAPQRNRWLPVLWVFLVVIALVVSAFVYLAKSPIEIRKNNSPIAATPQTDSTQQIYLGIYNDAVQALQNGNYLAAISYFDEAIESQKLPNYNVDAARFLKSVAYAQQQPNKATKHLKEVTSEKTFAYPYTNKDTLQVQCKILWARLMGWND